MTALPKPFLVFPVVAALFLSGCGTTWFGESEDTPLEGDRMSLYDFEKTLQQDADTQFGMDGLEDQTLITLPDKLAGGADTSISLAQPWTNQFWPQVGGYPNHAMKNVALAAGLAKAWSTGIGRGGQKDIPLTSAPIVADGMVFTLDSRSTVQAVDAADGDVIWTQRVLPEGEEDSVIGGGLAYSGGAVFVTGGFNEVLALNPATGEILWRSPIEGAARAAPAAVPGRVFVVTLDNKTIALDAATGRQIWRHSGLSETASVLGAATPAITRDAVITAYNSGEIYALRIENGQELWSDNLAPLARAAGQMTLSDIRALPVIDGNFVYAVSYANRMAAIDMRTGRPVWQANIGSTTTPWLSGNRIFVISSENTLISLDRDSGELKWQRPLPRYEDPEDREGVITWQGPILAGTRLLAFSSSGKALEFDPVTGEILKEWELDGEVTLAPAVANNTLYTINRGGDLTAWR